MSLLLQEQDLTAEGRQDERAREVEKQVGQLVPSR